MKKITIVISLFLISFLLVACDDDPVSSNELCVKVSDTSLYRCDLVLSSYFDTSITLTMYIEKDVESEPILEEVKNIVEEYHVLSDKYNTYENIVNVKTINDDPATTHIVNENLFNMIKFSLNHQLEVNSLFNIALNPVLEIWHDYSDECNFDPYLNEGTGDCLIPTSSELDTAAQYIDQSLIILDESNLSVTMSEGMSIDLGGMSKGYMSNVVTNYLDSLNIYGYLFNAGASNVEIGGTHPTRDSGQFLLAITDPTNTNAYYATVYLSGGESIVTSGDYQRYYVSNEEIYHHIIHPTTLMPERYTSSVSVIYNDPALADIYSTAIFLMPIEEGIEFVNSIDGLEAIWYGVDGVIHYSENFEENYLDSLY